MEEIHTKKAFSGNAPLSQAIKHGGTVYVSGCVPYPPGDNSVVSDDLSGQTRRVMENISVILEEAGTSLDNVLRTRVFLKSFEDFAEMNAAYEEYVSPPYPARTAVQANLAKPSIKVEIDVTAHV